MWQRALDCSILPPMVRGVEAEERLVSWIREVIRDLVLEGVDLCMQGSSLA